MADSTNIYDAVINATQLAQKWVDDALEGQRSTGSAQSRIELRHKLFETAFAQIIEMTRAGALKLAGH